MNREKGLKRAWGCILNWNVPIISHAEKSDEKKTICLEKNRRENSPVVVCGGGLCGCGDGNIFWTNFTDWIF